MADTQINTLADKAAAGDIFAFGGAPAGSQMGVMSTDLAQGYVNNNTNSLNKMTANTANPLAALPGEDITAYQKRLGSMNAGVGTGYNLPNNGAPTNNGQGNQNQGNQGNQGSQNNGTLGTPGTNYVTYINPATGQSQKLDPTSITPDSLQSLLSQGYHIAESGGTVPGWILSGSPDLGRKQAELDAAKAEIDSIKNDLNKFTVSDADLKSQTDAISKQWDSRITDIQRINSQQLASIRTLGIRLGDRWTGGEGGMFGSIITEEERQGVNRIADLESKKQEAISAAREAARSQNWQVFQKKTDLAEASYKEKLDAVSELNKTIAAQNQKVQDEAKQATRDNAIAKLMGQGINDPAKLLASLNFDQNGKRVDNYTLKEITDAMQSLLPKDMSSVMLEAAKYGAPADVLTKISQARTTGEMISAAAGYLNDPTSLGGQYAAYTKTTTADGKTPMSPSDFVAAQKYADALATAKANSTYKYQDAFAEASAKAAVDAANVGGNKNQQKLEQEYRSALLKELSNRSGGLGLQDQKVNQAIHLRSLFDQFKDPNSGEFNIPQAQYAEIAMGLANLISGSNAVSDTARQEILQRTAKGDFNGAISYLTGTPQRGSTQAVLKNLYDSVIRQGTVAQNLRDEDVKFLQGLAPTDLDPSRKSALEQNLLPSFTNPIKNVEAAAKTANDALLKFHDTSPANAKIIDDIHAQFPNLSGVEIAQKLGLIQ